MFLLRMVLAKGFGHPLVEGDQVCRAFSTGERRSTHSGMSQQSIQVHACIKGGVVQETIHTLVAFRSLQIPSAVSGTAEEPEPSVVDCQRR